MYLHKYTPYSPTHTHLHIHQLHYTPPRTSRMPELRTTVSNTLQTITPDSVLCKQLPGDQLFPNWYLFIPHTITIYNMEWLNFFFTLLWCNESKTLFPWFSAVCTQIRLHKKLCTYSIPERKPFCSSGRHSKEILPAKVVPSWLMNMLWITPHNTKLQLHILYILLL